MASLKQATYVREQFPDAEVTIYYIDLRTPERYDKFMRKVRADEKVSFVKGKVAGVAEESNGDITIEVEDAVRGIKKKSSPRSGCLGHGNATQHCRLQAPDRCAG